ncbi:MAG: TrmB family transcriptional regulator [Candidatus Woesearchaeota archaeon]
MEKEQILEENGFSKSESKVYLTLLKLGETKSGQIIKETSLQSSVVHNALNTLTNKGFITHVLKGKIKHYQALDPKLIEEYIKTKQEQFQKILPELNILQSKASEEPITVEVYEGYKGLFAATLNLLEDSKKGDVFKYFAAHNFDEKTIKFFEKVDLIKKDKKIITKGIANQNAKKYLQKYKNSKINFTSQIIPPAMNIFKDKIIIFNLGEKPQAILIKSSQIANQYDKLWEAVWNS